MAVNIPIWSGSSSFSSGSTPFGFFDNDPLFAAQADRVATWCTTRLGYPLTDIELQDIHIYACFEEAVLEYSNQVNQFSIRDNLYQLQGTPTGSNLTGLPINPTLGRLIAVAKNYGTEAGSGGYVTYKSASIDVTSASQVYDLANFTYENPSDVSESIEIKTVFHTTPPALVRYFDPFIGTGMGSQSMLEGFGWGMYSPSVSFLMMPLYQDLLRLQAIEFNDMIRKSHYSFEITGTQIRIFPVPTTPYKLWIHYITVKDRNDAAYLYSNNGGGVVGDITNAPYELHTYSAINPAGRQWIYKYTLALAKEVLGNIRSKYSSIPIPGSEVTLNGAELLSQAVEEKTELVTQLRENLEAVSRETQLNKLTSEADNIQGQLSKIPLTIYIG